MRGESDGDVGDLCWALFARKDLAHLGPGVAGEGDGNEEVASHQRHHRQVQQCHLEPLKTVSQLTVNLDPQWSFWGAGHLWTPPFETCRVPSAYVSS